LHLYPTVGCGTRAFEKRADIDIVEFLELDAVDRDDGLGKAEVFAAMHADEAADIAVPDEHA